MARIIIAGATGFIGRHLCQELKDDYELIALTRDAEKAKHTLKGLAKPVTWNGKTSFGWGHFAEGAHAIVNLAGENIGASRWTQQEKQKILQSRIEAAQAIVEAVQKAKDKPKVVLHSSAVGYYGKKAIDVDESDQPGMDFPAKVSLQPENIARMIENDTRLVIIRTGAVIGATGGILSRMLPAFKFYMGGTIGSGDNHFSWISMEDQVRAMRFLLENGDLSGPFNLTSPGPVTMDRMAKAIGKIIGKPAFFHVPAPLAKIALGQVVSDIFLADQKILPKRLLQAGFVFKHPDLESALQDQLN